MCTPCATYHCRRRAALPPISDGPSWCPPWRLNSAGWACASWIGQLESPQPSGGGIYGHCTDSAAAAATVTCFLATYKSEQVFAVTVTVWAVTGLVSLAAITGGVALMGRLAQLDAGLPDEEEEESAADTRG